VVIEDSLVGLRAAKAAGMRCVVTYTASTKDQDFFAEGAAQGPPSPHSPPPFLVPRTLVPRTLRAGFHRRPSLTFHTAFRRITLHIRRRCFQSGGYVVCPSGSRIDCAIVDRCDGPRASNHPPLDGCALRPMRWWATSRA